MANENNTEQTALMKANVAVSASCGLVPHNIDEMYRISSWIAKSGYAPSSFKTPEQIMVAIQYGMELGITPIKALKSLCVVNGNVTLWGDMPLALVRKSGLMEWIIEKIEGEDDNMTAICITKRKRDPEPIERRFSVADAKRANLWNKQGSWRSHPLRMLQYKARAFALRDVFPDVLAGIHSKEELEGEDMPDYETPNMPDVPRREERESPEAKTVTLETIRNDAWEIFESYVPSDADVDIETMFLDTISFICKYSLADLKADKVEPTITDFMTFIAYLNNQKDVPSPIKDKYLNPTKMEEETPEEERARLDDLFGVNNHEQMAPAKK